MTTVARISAAADAEADRLTGNGQIGGLTDQNAIVAARALPGSA